MDSVKFRIVQIMNKLRVGKLGENSFSKYNYFRPDDILINLNPLLLEHKLITICSLINRGTYYECILRIEATDKDEAVIYQFDIDKATVKGANEAQNSGATLTYAKRYALMNAFNLADNALDFDSNEFQRNNYITEEQRKELFKIAKSQDIVKKAIEEFGYSSTALIKNEDFHKIKKFIEEQNGLLRSK